MPRPTLFTRYCLMLGLPLALAACGSTGSETRPGVTTPPSQNTPPTTPPPSPTPTTPPPATQPPPDDTKPAQPQVTSMLLTSEETRAQYRKDATGVALDVAVTANIYLPTQGVGVRESTLQGNVLLYESSSKTKVAGSPGTDGAGGNITFTPREFLKPGTKYTFEVTSGVKDEKGTPFVPFTASFTTGNKTPKGPIVLFDEMTVHTGSSLIASLRVGPDGKLYATTLDGKIMRWTIESDGRLTGRQTLELDALKGRALIGIAHDPQNPNVLWISNNAPLPFGPVAPPADFSSKISRITLSDDPAAFTGTLEDYVVGLPRSIKDHLTNSVVFGPDGALYVTQGSNSSTGDADPTWIRRERLLSGAVLRIDPRRDITAGPINVQTENDPETGTTGNYNPDDADAPVTIFADGVRNAYDLVWHDNRFLYIPTNGGAAGGSTPASPDGSVPALKNVSNQNDYLFRTSLNDADRSAYFGHPNPLRGHYVLNGGNPTAGKDVAEVVADAEGRSGYPVGTQPDPNYRPPTHDFGANRSPNGAIQYRSNAFEGKLKDRLLVAEYSNGKDIVALQLGANGNVVDEGRIGSVKTGKIKRFEHPLDLAEDGRNGNLYVAEMVPQPGAGPTGRITLLRVP